MTKMNWSKAGEVIPDPARVQKDSFLPPDPVVIHSEQPLQKRKRASAGKLKRFAEKDRAYREARDAAARAELHAETKRIKAAQQSREVRRTADELRRLLIRQRLEAAKENEAQSSD